MFPELYIRVIYEPVSRVEGRCKVLEMKHKCCLRTGYKEAIEYFSRTGAVR